MLHDAHVVELKEDIYQVISDASKGANGFRRRLDIRDYTVAELLELEQYYMDAEERAVLEQRAREEDAIVEWEAHISNIMSMMSLDRISALAVAIEPFAEADEYVLLMDGCLNHDLGLPYRYDWIRGERAAYNRSFV